MKKSIAVTIVAIMLLAMFPMTASAAAIDFDEYVEVTNYSSSGLSYNPSVSSKSSVTITGPYDSISQSSVSGGKYGVNYMVKFFLDGSLDLDNDIVYLNGTRMDNYGLNNGKLTVSRSVVTCTFLAERGGNQATFNVRVYDKSEGSYFSKSVTITYKDSNYTGSGTTTSDDVMKVDAYASTSTYNVWTTNGVIFVEYDGYANRVGSLVNVSFKFIDSDGDRIPYYGSAELYDVTSNGQSSFLYTTSSTRTFRSDMTAAMYIDPTNTRAKFRVYSDGVLHESVNYVVVWKDISQGTATSGTGLLNISPSRAPTITVGQDYTFTISSNNIYNTGTYFTLDVSGTSGVVSTATGKYLTIRGLSAGQTWLNVRGTNGAVIDTIPVTVVSSASSSASSYLGIYRVTAGSLNVRSGPGTGYSVIGNLKSGAQVTVNSLSGGWANISWGVNSSAYVSQAYLAFVSGNTTSSSTSSTTTTTTTGTTSSGLGSSTGATDSSYGIAGGLGGGYVSNDSTWDEYGYMVVAVNWTSVMDGPGSGYAVLGYANSGERLRIYSVSDGWALISWEGQLAFVRYAHLY